MCLLWVNNKVTEAVNRSCEEMCLKHIIYIVTVDRNFFIKKSIFDFIKGDLLDFHCLYYLRSQRFDW